MVFSGADLSAIFAAADANDQTLTKDIWSARGGDQFVTYAQCRRRYNAFKKARDEGDGEEEDAGAATPVAEKRHSRTAAGRMPRTGKAGWGGLASRACQQSGETGRGGGAASHRSHPAQRWHHIQTPPCPAARRSVRLSVPQRAVARLPALRRTREYTGRMHSCPPRSSACRTARRCRLPGRA